MDSMEVRLRDNPDKSRFEFDLEGQLGIVEYILAKVRIYLTHSEVPESLGGKGYGSLITKLTLEHVKASGLKLVSKCPFITSYIKKHAQWQEIVDPEHPIEN